MKEYHWVLQFDEDWTQYRKYDINWSMCDNVLKYSISVYTNMGTLCVI